MGEKIKEDRRSQLGYGSSYRMGRGRDLTRKGEIGSVLGGQVWMVKPDRDAQAANPCLWMQAGSVNFKNCSHFYDCTTCKYDVGMRKRVDEGKQLSWQDAMRMRGGLDRICRHSLTNRIEKRACAYDYECSRCEFDQFFEDVWSTKAANFVGETQSIKGFEVPTGHYFHNGHTWARIESGGYIRVGMDDFSHKLLGRADGFDLPLMGKELNKERAGWGLKRKENSADVLSPIDGVIVEVNSDLREQPAAANEEPYNAGWMFVVQTPDVKGTVKGLLSGDDTVDWMNGELGALEKMIEGVAGPLAADGGYLTDDIYGHLPDLGWRNITKRFLGT
jgi:glycine cleavage system H lipoate-binding protein